MCTYLFYMNYHLINDVIDLVEEFEKDRSNEGATSIDDFKKWVSVQYAQSNYSNEPNWEGKENGRSPESVISTLLVHMNRYAKNYSKSAMFGSDFSTQEDFIYLINLRAFGEMNKMDLIKKNVHEKPAGIQIINRLINQGWIDQSLSEKDKRSKVLKINNSGLEVLDLQMDKIRKATEIVTGDLKYVEKMELIHLLSKLDAFHQNIYDQNIDTEHLLCEALKTKN